MGHYGKFDASGRVINCQQEMGFDTGWNEEFLEDCRIFKKKCKDYTKQ